MHKTFGDNFKIPLNTGRGKSIFSFPKGDRFAPTKQTPCKTSYNIQNEQRMARTTSFGFGERSTIINSQRGPEPTSYEPLDQSKLKKGFTFSLNKRVSFVDQECKKVALNPSPTNYEKAVFGKSCSFSFRSKYEDPLEGQKLKLGPGQYRLRGLINPKGNYYESKYKNSQCGKIGKEKRFSSAQTFVPGPGKYKDTLAIDPEGVYFNSKIQSKGIRSFGKPRRQSLFAINASPGPGTYYDFPHFGPYSSR